MNKGLSITISASLIMTATQAMASVQKKVDLEESNTGYEELDLKIDAALEKRDVKQKINESYLALINHFSENGITLSEKYMHDPAIRTAANGQPWNDSTYTVPGGFSCYTNCHGNCHSNCHGNCHGSRGWR